MRRAASAAVFAGGSLFAYSRWTRWVEGMPTLEPPSGSLIASADAESPAACAVCAPVHARDLAGLGVTSRGGSNYATLDAALLETILDRLVAAHARTTTPSAAAAVGGDSSTATADRGSRHARSDFGPERLIDTSTPSLWLAVSVREPRWVGDDQMVRPSMIDASRSRRSRLHALPPHTGAPVRRLPSTRHAVPRNRGVAAPDLPASAPWRVRRADRQRGARGRTAAARCRQDLGPPMEPRVPAVR